ncbi:MAG: hypothetical protein ACI89X_001746 [Planctomycetota bacterium]|jgi:hypothetical protein
MCARTDAVLAVHLDGDLAHEAFDREACEPLGYGFVSDDSLHSHLRECATCQTALQRARRLDAALASMAGRAVADQVAASGYSLEELSDQWLKCAALAAGSEAIATGSTDETCANVTSAEEANLVQGEDLDWLFDRAMQVPDAADVARAGSPSRVGTLIAMAGVLAACLATWLCISTLDGTTGGDQTDGHAFALQLASGQVATPELAAASQQATEGTSRPATEETGEPENSEPALVPRRAQQSLARRMHAARNRELPEQRTARPEDLSYRVRNRALSVPERLAAAQRLLRATRAGSSAARYATDQLLLALAGCGDLDQDDIALHEQLLDEVRSNGPVLVRLEHRLASLPARNRDRSELSHQALAAILVAARVENARLDQALRRGMRRNGAIADVVASALRCGVRATGTAQLLLACWHDQVAIGKQENTPKWAEFWFRGQATTSFAQLAQVHARSHSAPERVRCLLAMGCVHDNSTLPRLLAGLAAPRRVEACAAACGIASLPHRVLKQLLPKAKLQNAGLLRAALARAGMPEANRWIQTLALSKPQLRLMRTGPITRFSEVAAWFRNAILTAD